MSKNKEGYRKTIKAARRIFRSGSKWLDPDTLWAGLEAKDPEAIMFARAQGLLVTNAVRRRNGVTNIAVQLVRESRR